MLDNERARDGASPADPWARQPAVARTRRRFLREAAGLGGLALSGSLLSACGLGGDSAGEALTETVARAQARGEVVIWDRTGDLYRVFDALIPSFNQKYPDVRVRHVAVDIATRLPPTLASGAGVPDGAFLDDVQVPGQALHLTDVRTLMSAYTGRIVRYKVDVNTVDGRLVGIPWDLDPGLLYYREDLLDRAGVDPQRIASYDDLTEAARTLRARLGDDVRPLHLERDPFLGQLWVEMLANQQGTSMADAEGRLQLETEPYQRIMRWIKTIVDEGLGTHANYLQPTDVQTLDNGRQILVPWAMWWIFAPQSLLRRTSGRWRATQLPSWTPDGARSGVMGGGSFIIPARAKSPELAWLWYEHLLFTAEGYRTVYGPSATYPRGLNTSVPSYEPALDGPPLFEPVAALGNQDIWAIDVAAAREVPGNYSIPSWWADAVRYFGANIQQLMDGRMEPDEVLAVSTQQIQKNLVDRRR